MSINFDLYYYKNIMVKHTDICINDLSDDYITLKNYDISGTGDEPPMINEFDVSSIFFNIDSTQVNGIQLNRKIIKDVSSVYLPGIYLNKLKFDFKRDVSLNNFKIYDNYDSVISYSIVDAYGNSNDFNSSHDISTSSLTNNILTIDFSNNISVPYKITFDRSPNDNIFKFNSDNIIESNILREKVNNNFNWINSPWKQISISNETFSLTDISINKLNDLLSNVVNQQNRPIFPSDYSAIEIISLENGYIKCVINFKYKGYAHDEFNYNSEISYNDLSFVTITHPVGGARDISYNYYISTNLYLDSSSSLFKYLNLFQSSDPSLSDPSYVVTNNINETAIKLPLDHDISFNFTFKPYSEIDTDIYYGTSLNNFKYYTSINNLIDKIPIKDHCGGDIENYSNYLSASHIISPTSSTILSIDNSPIIYEENSKINMKFNKLKSKIIDASNIDAKKLVSNSLDISRIDCSNITINSLIPKSNSSPFVFEPSQNFISINSNHILVDASHNQFCSNYSTIKQYNTNNLNIINSLNYDFSSTIVNSVDTSYAYILSYNSKNIICYDNCSSILSFGISSEGINNNINFDIKKNLLINNNTATGNFESTTTTRTNGIDSSYDIITPYTADINTIRVNDIYITSDDRLKYDEKDISNAMNIIELLQSKIYVKTNTNTVETGYIAQEVKNITDLSYVVDIFNGTYYLNYTAIQPYLVKSIQELYSIILAQTGTINELKSELQSLQ